MYEHRKDYWVSTDNDIETEKNVNIVSKSIPNIQGPERDKNENARAMEKVNSELIYNLDIYGKGVYGRLDTTHKIQ